MIKPKYHSLKGFNEIFHQLTSNISVSKKVVDEKWRIMNFVNSVVTMDWSASLWILFQNKLLVFASVILAGDFNWSFGVSKYFCSDLKMSFIQLSPTLSMTEFCIYSNFHWAAALFYSSRHDHCSDFKFAFLYLTTITRHISLKLMVNSFFKRNFNQLVRDRIILKGNL